MTITSQRLKSDITEPITLSEAKEYLRINYDSEEHDAMIESLVSSARTRIEDYCRRSIVAQSRLARVFSIPQGGFVLLPFPEILSVESVKRRQADGSFYEFDVGKDLVVETGEMGGFRFSNRETGGDLFVEYRAGYDADLEDIPAPLKHAILILTYHYYDNPGGAAPMPDDVKNLIEPYCFLTLR